jgi:hypothetical protein
MIEALQRPGPTILFVVAACGLLLGELAFRWVLPDMIWAASATIASAAGTAIAFVWGAQKHAEERMRSLSGLSLSELRNVEHMLDDIRRRVLLLTVLLAVCVALALLPWASKKLVGSSWHWMYLIAGGCLGVSAFGLLVALGWRNQVDAAVRERQIEAESERRSSELLSSLQRSMPDVNETSDWARQPPRELNGEA